MALSPPKPPRRADAAGADSRLAAAQLLFEVMEIGADLESALEKVESFSRLEGADRSFARAIASAALRGLGRIDWALGELIDRPLDQIEAPLRALLRAGCAQLWLLGVADHAAVSATVDAARSWREARRGGGLVNAVLRRASREAATFALAPPTSIWPDWLAAKLKSALGPEGAARLAEFQLDEPPLDLTLKPGRDPAEWAMALGGEALSNGTVRLKAGQPIAALPGYDEGEWWVQDAAASLPARLLGEVNGLAVAELCAAPGGKSLQLAAAGARLEAIDISRQRLAVLTENAKRTRLSIHVLEADARLWRPDRPLEAILLDAPCSALGIIRRHPEGAWRRNPADLARFPKLQAALIASSREMLKPGGRLVYCVCTPSPEEGREVIAAALAGGGWRRDPIRPEELPGFAHALTREGDVITAPPVLGEKRDSKDAAAGIIATASICADVFYVTRLEREG